MWAELGDSDTQSSSRDRAQTNASACLLSSRQANMPASSKRWDQFGGWRWWDGCVSSNSETQEQSMTPQCQEGRADIADETQQLHVIHRLSCPLAHGSFTCGALSALLTAGQKLAAIKGSRLETNVATSPHSSPKARLSQSPSGPRAKGLLCFSILSTSSCTMALLVLSFGCLVVSMY